MGLPFIGEILRTVTTNAAVEREVLTDHHNAIGDRLIPVPRFGFSALVTLTFFVCDGGRALILS